MPPEPTPHALAHAACSPVSHVHVAKQPEHDPQFGAAVQPGCCVAPPLPFRVCSADEPQPALAAATNDVAIAMPMQRLAPRRGRGDPPDPRFSPMTMG
jgi:hypothetical protein